VKDSDRHFWNPSRLKALIYRYFYLSVKDVKHSWWLLGKQKEGEENSYRGKTEGNPSHPSHPRRIEPKSRLLAVKDIRRTSVNPVAPSRSNVRPIIV